MNRLPHISIFFAAILLMAADKKPEKAKEPVPSAVKIQQWVKQLGDDNFKVREDATRNLIKAGEAALNAVTKATKSEDAEVKQRALMILKHPEKVAIAYFKKLGGEVKVDENSPGNPVIELSLVNTTVTDTGLVHLKGLTKLQGLDLFGTKITDAGLVHLKGLTKLQELNLGGNNVTDAGLVHLSRLQNLKKLSLSNFKTTGSLLSITLNAKTVTQAGIQKLQKSLPNCKIEWEIIGHPPNPLARPGC